MDSDIKENIDYSDPYYTATTLEHYLDILPDCYAMNIPFQNEYRRNFPINTDQEVAIFFAVEGLKY